MEIIEELSSNYITSYISNNYEASNFYLNKINYQLYNSKDTVNELRLYLTTICSHREFILQVTKRDISTQSFKEAINNFLSHYDKDKNTCINLSLFGPEFIVMILNNYKTSEIFNIKKLASLNIRDIEILLNNGIKENTINIKYDQSSYYSLDHLTGRLLPINGHPDINMGDYHLPLHHLIAKYIPHSVIHLSNKIKFDKYIYILSYYNLEKTILENKLIVSFSKEIIDDINNKKVVLILNSLNESLFIKYNAHLIKKQLKLIIHPAAFDNIFILSGNMAERKVSNNFHLNKLLLSNTYINAFKNISIHSKYKLQIENFEYFEEAAKEQYKRQFDYYTYSYRLNIIKKQHKTIKYFICLNRVIKDYRVALSYFFFKYKLLEKSYISQNKLANLDLEKLQKSRFRNIFKEKEFNQFLKSLPYIADTDNFAVNSWNIIPKAAMNNSFVFIVSETFFFGRNSYELEFFTEKTYKPIRFFMPFIICGNFQSLKKLKKMGYKTFDKWWDESYDDILNPEERLKSILKTIRQIAEFSSSDLLRIYIEMEDTLNHNYQLFLNRNAGQETIIKIIERYKSL